MPRNYKAKPGSKRYKKYDSLVIKQALDELSSTSNSLSAVAQKYNIAKSVLCRHKNREMKPHGRPTALTKEEELLIVENLNICGDWGYPLDTTDLRHIIKLYLDSMNIKHAIFNNNFPGIDYVNGFLKRHSDKISQRLCQNIKRSRAAVSAEVIKQYFSELYSSLNNVPIQNIINYDETNLTDDPGRKKVIVRRGCKYPERVVNHSKGSTSLMMAATAEGDFLPPYVVYKATHLYDTWTTKGPHNARYNRSTSGWFEGHIFEDWVKTIVIPFFEQKEGKKVLIGDNLSSHLSIEIIQLCQEKNIHFIFLPANSTHLTQPLDVSVFRPMKMIWRKLLDKWKKTDDGRTQTCVPKGCFPQLLKCLMDELNLNAKKNIIAGFKKCGIHPIDASQVLSRLPMDINYEEARVTAVNDSFYNVLKEMRYGSMSIREPKKKRKLEVVAGRSVSAAEVSINEDQEPVKQKKKITVKQSISTPKIISLKGKGIGKKTKPKFDELQLDENGENKNLDTSQDTIKNGINIIQGPFAFNDRQLISEPMNFSIDSMPIVFCEQFDCQEIVVRTADDEVQKYENRSNNHEKENVQIKTKQDSKINIISDIRLKLPLPMEKIGCSSNEKSNRTHSKRKRSLDIYKDADEIMKILEEN